MREILEKKFEILHKSHPQKSDRLSEYRERILEKEINVACGNCRCLKRMQKSFEFHIFCFHFAEFSHDRILALFRNWKNKSAQGGVDLIKNSLREKLPSDNHSTLE